MNYGFESLGVYMGSTVETRCTQCGYENTNELLSQDTKHGTGSSHGTEEVMCEECSGECDLDSCERGSPCDRCHTETVQNRCGSSVPTAQM